MHMGVNRYNRRHQIYWRGIPHAYGGEPANLPAPSCRVSIPMHMGVNRVKSLSSCINPSIPMHMGVNQR